MAVDQLTPGEIPWKHLAATPELPSLERSYDQALAYNFDIYVNWTWRNRHKRRREDTARNTQPFKKFLSIRLN